MNVNKFHYEKISEYGAKYIVSYPECTHGDQHIALCFTEDEARKICVALNFMEFGDET